MSPVEAYLEPVRAVRLSGAGVPETSYYPALSNLLNEIGRTLTPKARCIITLANRGAGLPDGGLFTAEQLRRTADEDAFTAQVPSRGALPRSCSSRPSSTTTTAASRKTPSIGQQ